MSKSRRRQNVVHIHSFDISADIHEQEHAQNHTQFVDNPLTRFADIENREHICVGPEADDRLMLKILANDDKHIVKKHVRLGPVDDDYDDHDMPVCSPLRSVCPICFDLVYSQDGMSEDVVGTAEKA